MTVLSYLFGAKRLRFLKKHREQVYNGLLVSKITVISSEESEDTFALFVSHGDAKVLLMHLLSVNITPKDVESIGLPRFVKRLLRRSGLLLGLILGIALFLFARSRVWEIELYGSGTLDPDLLREELRDVGLSEGMSFCEFDPKTVSFEMQKLDRRIAWMQIRRRGVHVIVEWIPSKLGETVNKKPSGIGANLIAEKDAVIVDVQIDRGEGCVSVGSVVRAGELLVSGVGTHSSVYASGRVIGRVKETVRISVPRCFEEVVVSKCDTVGVALEIFGHRFLIGEDDGALCEKGTVYLFERVRLPIFWETLSQVDYLTHESEFSETDMARIARRKLSERLGVLLTEGELLTTSLSGSYDSEGYTLIAEIEYLINIAKTLEFSIENE